MLWCWMKLGEIITNRSTNYEPTFIKNYQSYPIDMIMCKMSTLKFLPNVKIGVMFIIS